MQLHENHSIKRAGVAGLRARAKMLNGAYLFKFQRAGMVKTGGNLASAVRC